MTLFGRKHIHMSQCGHRVNWIKLYEIRVNNEGCRRLHFVFLSEQACVCVTIYDIILFFKPTEYLLSVPRFASDCHKRHTLRCQNRTHRKRMNDTKKRLTKLNI